MKENSSFVRRCFPSVGHVIRPLSRAVQHAQDEHGVAPNNVDKDIGRSGKNEFACAISEPYPPNLRAERRLSCTQR